MNQPILIINNSNNKLIGEKAESCSTLKIIIKINPLYYEEYILLESFFFIKLITLHFTKNFNCRIFLINS